MPQLWTETFITQYFWLLLILLTFYYFINTKVIPIIASNIKARQISDSSEISIENLSFINDKSINLFNIISKYQYLNPMDNTNWDSIQNEWLLTNPEDNTIYWVENNFLSNNNINIDEEELDLTLEEFLQNEEK